MNQARIPNLCEVIWGPKLFHRMYLIAIDPKEKGFPANLNLGY